MKINEIKIKPGRRDTQQKNVEELSRSIAVVGLMNPISVTQDNTLIAGLSHRELGDLFLRRKGLYEAIYPETRQGQRDGQTAKNANFSLLETKSFSQDTVEKLGVSKRTVEQIVLPFAT